MQTTELHPWKWYAPEGSRFLIVGTFPTATHNWSYDFFYPNKANLFWSVMAQIAETELKYFSGNEAVTERKNILQKLKVAVTDMGNKVIRNDNSSLDEKLVPLEYMDIFRILDENPRIEKIIFTSSSGKASAAGWFKEFLLLRQIHFKFPKGEKPIRNILSLGNKEIETVILHSTSRRAANRISFEKLLELYRGELQT